MFRRRRRYLHPPVGRSGSGQRIRFARARPPHRKKPAPGPPPPRNESVFSWDPPLGFSLDASHVLSIQGREFVSAPHGGEEMRRLGYHRYRTERTGIRVRSEGAPPERLPSPSTICANPPVPTTLNWKNRRKGSFASDCNSGTTDAVTPCTPAEGTSRTPDRRLPTGVPVAEKAAKESVSPN